MQHFYFFAAGSGGILQSYGKVPGFGVQVFWSYGQRISVSVTIPDHPAAGWERTMELKF
jgi:hypothetical protein